MIQLPRDTIASALRVFAKAVSRKSTLPVLGCLHVRQQDGQVRLTSTDLDCALSFVHAVDPPALTDLWRKLQTARWQAEGCTELLVPLATLHQAVKSSDKGTNLVLTSGVLTYIACGQSCPLEFSAIEAKEFPNTAAPKLPKGTMWNDPFPLGERQMTAIAGAYASSSEDETRYVLNGIYLDREHDAIVGTDGRRCYVHYGHTELARLFGSAIVPNKATSLLLLIAEDQPAPLASFAGTAVYKSIGWECDVRYDKGKDVAEEDGKAILWQKGAPKKGDRFREPISGRMATVRKAARQPIEREGRDNATLCRFVAGPWTLHSKCIEGNYPNWRQVIPGDNDWRRKLDLGDGRGQVMHELLKRLPQDPGMNNPLRLTLDKGSVRMEAGGVALTQPLPGASYIGDPLKISANRTIFEDGLATLPSTLLLGDEMAPLQFKGEHSRYVLMPLRVA